MILDEKKLAEKIIVFNESGILTEEKAKHLMEYMIDPSFKPEVIQRVSTGAAHVCDWIRRKIGEEVLAYRLLEYRKSIHNKVQHEPMFRNNEAVKKDI